MAKIKFRGKEVDADRVWGEWFSSDAAGVDKHMRHFFQVLPHDPRCPLCYAPFQGAGGVVARTLFGKKRSAMNPRFCNLCDDAAHRYPGGAEVPMAMLFVDIRGATALSETMSPTEFSQLIQRFYIRATRVIIEEDGLVEKLAGDAVAAFWGAGFAGRKYVQRTVKAAQHLQKVMAQEAIPVGIGVHSGVAFFGVVGTVDGLTNISAIGEEVNKAARLSSAARAGEIIVSEQALDDAGIDGSHLESRRLELKGISEPVAVRVM